jgi:flagellar protein FliS
MNREKIHHYRETQIKTASKGRLIVMLYDGIIGALDTAIEAIPKKRFDEANTAIQKAQDIITELSMALNMEAGDFSSKLLNIYSYLNMKLIDGNVKKDTEPLVFVRKIAVSLREAWNQIVGNSPHTDIDEMKKGGGIDVAG